MPSVFFDYVTDSGQIVMPAALQERRLEGLRKFLKVYFRPNLVIELEILLSLVHDVHEGLLVDEVGRGEMVGVGIEP